MAVLHRIPVMQGDAPQLAENLPSCQWCKKELQPNDTVWECVGNINHYLVCDQCHVSAIVH
uniref:Uncharacterized protein n=1 Tax=viral metagenome TaxID=1070528 RepID=A0A6M3KB53_9ZZZZ